ncbi:hypothetical protein DFH06DRAFT_1165781 [Mycena polygramma]|nr:hypothetical protein DFH06DRAFT_1165781 [Mycena polygramma]
MDISAADLKEQGNALFAAKKFAEADNKYTGAIGAHNTADLKGLAVLYANRAACRLSLRRYKDASSDASKATQLDPTYPKAFARRASAEDCLGDFVSSTENWKHALDALPTSALTAAEQTQKAQYEASFKVAAAARSKLQNTVGGGLNATTSAVQSSSRSPWDRAAKIVPHLSIRRPVPSSSAWVINAAYKLFVNGLGGISQLQKDKTTGRVGAGMLGAIANLTNAIMYDVRVLHFPDGDFLAKYNDQTFFERRACVILDWGDYGPDDVIQAVLAKRRSEGWRPASRAVSLTVRGWIMQGVLNTHVKQMPEAAIVIYEDCLHVIRTLKKSWVNESQDDRGIIFEKSFSFGIQKLYIDALKQSCKDTDSSERLERLLEESERLIREVDEELPQLHPQQLDPAFVDSFYRYPRGLAYAMKGFYYNKMSVTNGNDHRALSRKAALEYLAAAECFPEDDEQHPWFLHAALTSMSNAHSFTLQEALDVMERIRLSTPKTKAIWEFSSLSPWGIFEDVERQEQLLRDSLAQGHSTTDSCFGADVPK